METLTAYIRPVEPALLHHLVFFQLGRRFACEALLAGQPQDQILLDLTTRFIPSHLYARESLKQARQLLTTSRHTLAQYQTALRKQLTALQYSQYQAWWQDEIEFLHQLEDAACLLPEALTAPLLPASRKLFEVAQTPDENWHLTMDVYCPQQHQMQTMTFPLGNQLPTAFASESIGLEWLGEDLWLTAGSTTASRPVNRLSGEIKWGRPLAQAAAAAVVTLQGLFLPVFAQPLDRTLMVENPLLPKKVSPSATQVPTPKPIASPKYTAPPNVPPKSPSVPAKPVTTPKSASPTWHAPMAPPKPLMTPKSVVPTTKQVPLTPKSVVPTSKQTPMAPKSVVPTSKQTPMAPKSVVPTSKQTPMAPKSVVPTSKQTPMAPKSVVPTSKQTPMAPKSVVPTSTQNPLIPPKPVMTPKSVVSPTKPPATTPKPVMTPRSVVPTAKPPVMTPKPVIPTAKPTPYKTAAPRYNPHSYRRPYYPPRQQYRPPARRYQAPAYRPVPGGTSYIVSRGESLSKIAQAVYGSSRLWYPIYAANRHVLHNPNFVLAGQRLTLPPKSAVVPAAAQHTHMAATPHRHTVAQGGQSSVYVVTRGDSLSKISKRLYGSYKHWPMLYRMNRKIVRNPHYIYPGQRLILPVR